MDFSGANGILLRCNGRSCELKELVMRFMGFSGIKINPLIMDLNGISPPSISPQRNRLLMMHSSYESMKWIYAMD